MTTVIEDYGYWTAVPYGDGWATFERINEDGSKTMWNEVAQAACPLDENGQTTSSKHPFYARVDASGTVLNCYDDIWKLVPHENTVIAVDAMLESGARFEDGEFLPPLPAPAVRVATARQAKIALSRRGHLVNANEAIADMPGQAGEEARIEWEYATLFEREHPLITSLGKALGLSSEDIDTLFEEANAI